MNTTTLTYDSGAYVTLVSPRAWSPEPHIITCRGPDGEMHDKIKCKDINDARDYFDAFCAIAKDL